MIDMKLIRTDPDLVRENIKKKFQDEKLPLVDEVIALDKELREASTRGDALKNQRNVASKRIGMLMGQVRASGTRRRPPRRKSPIWATRSRLSTPSRRSSRPRSKSACW